MLQKNQEFQKDVAKVWLLLLPLHHFLEATIQLAHCDCTVRRQRSGLGYKMKNL